MLLKQRHSSLPNPILYWEQSPNNNCRVNFASNPFFSVELIAQEKSREPWLFCFVFFVAAIFAKGSGSHCLTLS